MDGITARIPPSKEYSLIFTVTLWCMASLRALSSSEGSIYTIMASSPATFLAAPICFSNRSRYSLVSMKFASLSLTSTNSLSFNSSCLRLTSLLKSSCPMESFLLRSRPNFSVSASSCIFARFLASSVCSS